MEAEVRVLDPAAATAGEGSLEAGRLPLLPENAGSRTIFGRSSGYWLLVALLCLFSFFSFFDPSEPFLVKYFMDVKGLQSTEIYDKVFPTWTYSQFLIVLILGAISESAFGYKSVILVGIVGSIVENLIMIFGKGLRMMQLCEVAVAVKFAGSLVFSSFIYRLVPEPQFQAITSYTRSCFLLGSIASALLGQLLVSESVDLVFLLYIALFCCGIAALLWLAFPPEKTKASQVRWNPHQLSEVWSDLVMTYRKVIWLSIWVAVALAVHSLVMTYWQSLFGAIDPSANGNGYVFSAAYISAALVTLIPPRIEPWLTATRERWLVPVVSFMAGGCLLFLGLTRNVIPGYVVFVIYHCIFEFSISIAYSQVATRIPSTSPQPRRFALVFSINNTASMLVQVLLQLLLQLSNATVNTQFQILGGTLFVLGALCVVRLFLPCLPREGGSQNQPNAEGLVLEPLLVNSSEPIK